jgi:mono/diheme cytochrome c family protein
MLQDGRVVPSLHGLKKLGLAGEDELLRSLLDSSGDGVYATDLEGNCTFANPACVALLGFASDDDLLGQHMHNLVHHTRANGDAYPVEECQIYQAFHRGWGTHVDDEIMFRAIREGTYPNGHRMPLMSAQAFRVFSQDDLDSVVAYLRSAPAVESDLDSKQGLSIIAAMMIPIGMLPLKDQPDSNVPPPAVPKGPTAAYGEYIAGYVDCALCHGQTLEGGPGGIIPPGPTLRGVAGWQTADFITAMRTGVTPAGKELSEDMPWDSIGKFDDETLTAIFEYLREL